MDNLMGTAIQPDVEPTKEEKTLAMLAHLLTIFFGFIPGLVIWLIKKDQSRFAGENAFQAMIFSIGVFVAMIALSILSVALQFIPAIGQILGCVFCIVYLGVIVYAIVLLIQGAMKANAGMIFKYPLTGDLFAYPGGGSGGAGSASVGDVEPPPPPPTEPRE